MKGTKSGALAVVAGELKCEIPVVISNHPDLEKIAESFGVPFRCFPLPARSGPEDKRAQARLPVLLHLPF
jgi:formyltetrahydrofolate hydrolase